MNYSDNDLAQIDFPMSTVCKRKITNKLTIPEFIWQQLEEVYKCLSKREKNFSNVRKALYPCPEVNERLDRLVKTVLMFVSCEQENQIVRDFNIKKILVDNIRRISISSEACLEEKTFDVMLQLNEVYKIQYIRKSLESLIDASEFKAYSKRFALFKALMVAFPRQLKSYFDISSCLSFRYFQHYENLVITELKLLTQPLPGSQKKPYAGRDLNKVKFAFVGSGLPITAIMLHIITGAQIALIDCEKMAISKAESFIRFCEALGILSADKFSFLHANVLDIQFFSEVGVKSKRVVEADVVDIASAIPRKTTRTLLNNNLNDVQWVRKRDVRGLSALLYEPFYEVYPKDPKNRYELVSEVAPLQRVISGAIAKDKLIAISSQININSCDLYRLSQV